MNHNGYESVSKTERASGIRFDSCFFRNIEILDSLGGDACLENKNPCNDGPVSITDISAKIESEL
jgi:hypothetical protein